VSVTAALDRTGRKPSLSGCELAVLQSVVIIVMSLSIDGATFMTLIIEGALGVSSSQSLAVTESLELRDMTDEVRPYTSSAIVPGGTGPGRAKMGKREFGVLVGVLFAGVVGDVTLESAHRRLSFGEQRLLDADGESMPLWVGEGLNAIDQGERLDGSADGLNPTLGRLVSSTGEPVQEFREHIDKLAPGLR